MDAVVVGCLSLLGGLALLWLGFAVTLLLVAQRHGEVSLGELARLLPDLLCLLRRLVADRRVRYGVRARLWLLLGYLLLPIDLIPDMIPVIGYLDDAVVVALTLRWVVAHTGIDPLRRNWPGTPVGLEAVLKLCRIGRGGPFALGRRQ